MSHAEPSLGLGKELLRDAFGRVREDVARVLEGLSTQELLWRPEPGANSIAWLVWHLSRIQDDHLAGVARHEQVWTSEGWYERFALPYAVRDHGYGHSPEQMGAFVLTDPRLLAGYHGAVHGETLAVLNAMIPDDYGRCAGFRQPDDRSATTAASWTGTGTRR